MRIAILDEIEAVLKQEYRSTSQQILEMRRREANKVTLRDPVFVKACELADHFPTRRQASKWNNGYGKAWQHRSQARKALNEVHGRLV